jgi:two-component system CheB/CheR fusion protein
MRACLAGETDYVPLTLDAVNRRGKTIHCKVTCTPLLTGSKVNGAILVMEEVDAH